MCVNALIYTVSFLFIAPTLQYEHPPFHCSVLMTVTQPARNRQSDCLGWNMYQCPSMSHCLGSNTVQWSHFMLMGMFPLLNCQFSLFSKWPIYSEAVRFNRCLGEQNFYYRGIDSLAHMKCCVSSLVAVINSNNTVTFVFPI